MCAGGCSPGSSARRALATPARRAALRACSWASAVMELCTAAHLQIGGLASQPRHVRAVLQLDVQFNLCVRSCNLIF